jgi:large repetitive protein
VKHTAMMRRLPILVATALVAVLALSGLASAATIPLAVTKTVPLGGATEVARTVNVKAYFNHDMNDSTFTSSTFKIRKQGTTSWLGATLSVNNTITPTSTNGSSQSVATLNPDANLAANTSYQMMIVGGSSGVKDVNGNALSTNKSWTFKTVTPPETTIDPSGPEGTVASDSASFAFSSTKPNSTFKCSLDGSTFAACTSPKDYPGPLSQGNHTFRVRAIDASGTQDPTPASRSWGVDTIAPDPPTITGPQGNGFVNASFTLSGTVEPNATVEVLEGTTSKGTTQANGSGVWSKALIGVSEGPHDYTATATDAAGNVSPESNAHTLTVDTTPPETTITTDLSGTVNITSATFAFSSEPNASFECSLDGGAFARCTPPKTVPDSGPLSDGQHTFRVRAIDAAGNADPTPDSRTWTVDATAPTVSILSPTDAATGVAPSTNVTATFSEAMNPSSISGQTFMLKEQGSNSEIGAAVSYSSATKTATLNPTADLALNTTYTAALTTGIKDQAGNALAQERSWIFTTATELTFSIEATPSTLNFTSDSVCFPDQKSVAVRNTGTGSVTVAPSLGTVTTSPLITPSSPPFRVSPTTPITIAPGASTNFVVSFVPTRWSQSVQYTGSLNLKDAGGSTLLAVPLQGSSTPCISL